MLVKCFVGEIKQCIPKLIGKDVLISYLYWKKRLIEKYVSDERKINCVCVCVCVWVREGEKRNSMHAFQEDPFNTLNGRLYPNSII